MNGEGTHLQPSAPPTPTDSTPAEKKVANSAAECKLNGRDHRVPVTYPGEMGLSKGVKDQYSQNPFYKIMHAPKAFKNFEVSDGFLSACICAIGWCSACSVPNIRIRKRRLQISIINLSSIKRTCCSIAHLGARKMPSYLREYLVACNGDGVTAFRASCADLTPKLLRI